jgi:hypothetical protein
MVLPVDVYQPTTRSYPSTSQAIARNLIGGLGLGIEMNVAKVVKVAPSLMLHQT